MEEYVEPELGERFAAAFRSCGGWISDSEVRARCFAGWLRTVGCLVEVERLGIWLRPGHGVGTETAAVSVIEREGLMCNMANLKLVPMELVVVMPTQQEQVVEISGATL